MKKRLLIILMITLIITIPLFSRANEDLAVGFQIGFLASGVVVDLPFGPLAVQAGLNYPLGFSFIQTVTGNIDDAFFIPFLNVSADITYPISLGDNFDLKVGVSTLAFTNFSNGLFGAFGGTIKGEYWMQEKDLGLFVNLSIPGVIYLFADGERIVFSDPLLPLIGLISSSVGVLYRL